MPPFVTSNVANESQAHSVVAQLRSGGFSDADISLLFPHEATASHVELENRTKAPEGAALGAGAGGALGAAVGWLVGLGTIALPGLGPLIAAGPLLAALSASAAGAAAGALTGPLVGLVIPEIEAKVYERRLQQGHYLVSVCCRTDHEIDLAEKVLKTAKAEDISSSRNAIAGT